MLDYFISLILAGQDSDDLSHSMLLTYIENIKRIGGPDRAFFYHARLQAMGHHLENLNNLHRTNISTIIDIEVS